MGTLWQDVRFGVRMLAKNPGFTAIALLTLALGIGANTAIFSVVNAVMLRPLPYRDSGRLVILTERWPQILIGSVSYQNYVDWRQQSQSFESMSAVRNTNATLTGAGEPERLTEQMANAGTFDLLGVKPALGRAFLPEEDRAGGPPVVLISYGLWQRRFGGSRELLGKPITLDNQPYTVIGVLPAGFEILNQSPDTIVPMEPWAKTLPDDRSWHPGIVPLARLKDGVSLEQARAEMETIAKRLERQYPLYDTNVGASVNLMQEQLTQNVRPALLMLLGAVGFVLLIACVNVANLLLARAAWRQKEIAVRTAMGAGRMRIVRQLLTESVTLSACGAGLGLLLAQVAMAPLLRLAATSLPATTDVNVDARVLGFTGGLAVLAGIIFGLAPALHTARLDLRATLNEAERGAMGGKGQSQLRSALVVTEVAVAMLLLAGAGLLIRSFERLSRVAPGFAAENLLVVDVPLSQNAYAKPAQRLEFFDRILESAAALPGVRAAGAASFLPVSGRGSAIHFNIQGRPPKSPHDFIIAGYRTVSPSYLQTLGVPLLLGRWLTPADRDGALAAVVINAAMAKEFFAGESPLGKHLQLGALPEKDVPWMEVVGVAGDVKQGLDTEPQSEMYVPYRQADELLPVFFLSVVLRTEADPLAETSALRNAVHNLDPDQPLVKFRTMEQNMSASIAAPRFRTILLALFSGIALILAAVGIYGLMAYTVTQRAHELGVRIALGAQQREIFRLVLGQGLRLVAAGVAIGVVATLVLVRVVANLLFGVSASDPLTLAGVAVLLTGVALAACYIPAKRAMRVDPMVALRYE